LNTWHIHIKGQVQGVGFRPFVYLLATEHGLKGWVNNANDGVHIQFNADITEAKDFLKAIQQGAPRLAHVASIRINITEWQDYSDFSNCPQSSGW
jgi:hydrogenase maturation protein HypF